MEEGGEGGGEGKRERRQAVTGIQTPAENSLAQNACFVICDITAINSTSTEADMYVVFGLALCVGLKCFCFLQK